MKGIVEPVAELREVSLSRSGRPVLDRVSLAVPPGAFVAVLGPNGAGKTSLLRVLDGELRPAAGSVRVLGANPGALGWRAAARWRRRIGVMPQLGQQAPAVPLSVREVVAIGRVARSDTDGGAAVAANWLAHLGLASLADRPFHRLSGGEQRRAHLARVFAQEPDLVLLDEPAGHLDFPAQETLVGLLDDLWHESGVTVVLVTHELRHLSARLSHVLLLREGRVVCQGPPETTLTGPALSETFGRELEVHTHHGRWFAAAPTGHG